MSFEGHQAPVRKIYEKIEEFTGAKLSLQQKATVRSWLSRRFTRVDTGHSFGS